MRGGIRVDAGSVTEYGKMHDTCPKLRLIETHPLAHATHRVLRQRATVFRPSRERRIDGAAILLQLLRAAADRDELRLHRLEQDLLAVDAPPARRRALYGNVLHGRGWTERFMKMIDVTNLGRSGIGPLDALGVG